jgi:glycosyltransferase involved in cell wall biosynthesis
VILQIDTLEELVTKRTPVVSLIYDLIPFIYKEHYQYVHLGGYTPGHIIGYSRMKLRWVILEHRLKLYKSSNKIISISNSSKNDLIEMVPGDKPSDIKVIPLSSGNFSQGKKSINIPELSTRRFIFYVGGADPRKGLVEFAKSLEKLWLNHPELYVVFAGKEITLTDVPEARKLNEVVSQLSKSNQVYLKGFVSDEELSWLYKNATAFVFPSRYEGFGLPVLEAMQAGCPVVAYNNSSIPEVAGNAAILVEDGKSMVPAIEKILDDSKYRNELIQLGKNQAAKFSWEKTARETLEVLVEAVNEG